MLTDKEELKENYKELYKQYNLERENLWSGNQKDCDIIFGLVKGTKTKTLLDYGCSHGKQYSHLKVHNKMGIDYENVYLYDIGIPEYSKKILHTVDGVISTDVLEHIPEMLLPDVLTEIFAIADKFVYLAVHCGLAKAILPNGENAHCTIHKPSWWEALIKPFNTKNLPLVIAYRIPTP